MAEEVFKISQRVELTGKGVKGTVAFYGSTEFATGIWVGVILDEAKGKNNGTVQDKQYFECQENHGVFVRPGQILQLDDQDNPIERKPKQIVRKLVEPKSRLSHSRISLASSRQSLTGSRQSLSGSRTHLASPSTEKTTSDAEAPPQNVSNIPKRSSFVETGFLETFKTQFNPGQPLISPAAASSEDKVSYLHLQQELENARAKIQDQSEQIETLKLKRKEDKEKMKDYEKMRIQLDHLSEFRSKIMESQASLQREVQKAKLEAREAVEAKESHAEEMADLAETMEMATLDKEMAEEKAETLQIELDACKERIEEMTLDLEILRAEMQNKAGAGGNASAYEIKQLEQQNARLRDTLVRLRDLSAHDKHEHQKLLKDLEHKKSEIAELGRTKEKLSARVDELESQIADLQEQVDAALGAEEMVVLLGEQKLTLEDRVSKLEEEVSELEALQDMNDQLVESNVELEMDLREELDMAHAATREAQREREAAVETITDRDQTIGKFRELVQKLQEQSLELQSRLEKESSRPVSALPEILDFKKMFTETKAHTKAIDLELRRIDVQQSQEHIKHLTAFMPDSFLNRGGDHDAILVLLLVPRMLFKLEILLSQVRDKFPTAEKVERSDLIKGHTVAQYAFRCKLTHYAHFLQAILHQYFHALNTCPADVFLKVGSNYAEIAAQERYVDNFVDLLKRDQLDENVSVDPIEKCVVFFNSMFPVLLGPNIATNHNTLVGDYARSLNAVCDLIAIDNSSIKALMESNNTGDMGMLIQHISTCVEQIQQQLKTIKRRMPTDPNIINFALTKNIAENLYVCNVEAGKVAKTLSDVVRSAIQYISTSGDADKAIQVAKMKDLAITASDRVYEQDDLGPIQSVKNSLACVQIEVAQLSQHLQENEYDIMASRQEEKPTHQPVVVRSQIVKKELGEIKNLMSKLENKESDLKELRKALKAKTEELSEMTIRKDLAEKKLGNVNKDYEMSVEKLQRKVVEMQNTLARKEKEFEATLDSLQTDIDSLESEKGELRDKLKSISKKAYLEGIVKSTSGSQLSSLHGPTLPAVVKDSPLLLQEIENLKSCLNKERHDRLTVQSQKMMERLNKLRPIPNPKRSSDDRVNSLIKEAYNIKNDLLMTWATTKVVDITNRKPGTKPWLDAASPRSQLIKEAARVESIKQRLAVLQQNVIFEVAKRKPGRFIKADFANYPSAALTKENEPIDLGKIEVPTGNPKSAEVITINVDYSDLKNLLSKLVD